MRLLIWRIRALVMVTLLFWQCGKTATGPEQQTLRERLIGTWWRQADEPESSGVDAVVFRFRDDGFMTSRLISFQEGGSQEWEVYTPVGNWRTTASPSRSFKTRMDYPACPLPS